MIHSPEVQIAVITNEIQSQKNIMYGENAAIQAFPARLHLNFETLSGERNANIDFPVH